MEVRKAELKDFERITEIAALLYLEIPDFVWNKKDYIEKQIKNGEYFVAEDNQNIVGIISLRERNSMLYIETLAVAKEKHGAGVGKELVEFAKSFARENDFKVLRTTSFYEYGVKDFYIKNGFELLDEPGEYNGHRFYRLEFNL